MVITQGLELHMQAEYVPSVDSVARTRLI